MLSAEQKKSKCFASQYEEGRGLVFKIKIYGQNTNCPKLPLNQTALSHAHKLSLHSQMTQDYYIFYS